MGGYAYENGVGSSIVLFIMDLGDMENNSKLHANVENWVMVTSNGWKLYYRTFGGMVLN